MKRSRVDSYDFNSITNYSDYGDKLTNFQEKESIISIIAPNALGKQVKYGQKTDGVTMMMAGSIMPQSLLTKIAIDLTIGLHNHGDYLNEF